ncbi:MAG TPA: hypothetical protein PKO06_25100, partial [Candidatus Ozemobacteraceae bacterium]|nr:hypothetical protein [Candidatus Ozemobacteraceae bacterium]
MHLLFRSDRRRWPLLLNCRLVIFGLVFCCLLITGAWGQELKRLPVVPDFDFDRLIASYPGFAEIASIAREH